MAQVISLQEVRYPSAVLGRRPSKKIGARVYDEGYDKVSCETSQPSPGKEDVFRAILLLDLAAQQARLLVKEIADPARREIFQAQIATIEQLIQIAREMALKL